MQMKNRYYILFLLIVVLGIYYPSLFIPFNTVDDTRMVNSLLNADGLSVWQAFSLNGSGYYYRPLLYATFIADKYLWGLHESFMHLENILLHAANVILVFLAAKRIAQAEEMPASTPLPLLAALLFAVHPLNTEAVNWISGRTDLLAALFVLGSLFLLLRALHDDSVILCLAAAVTMFVGSLAKETAIFFLPAAILLIFVHDKVSFRQANSLLDHLKKRTFFHIAFFLSGSGYLLLRSLAFAKGDSGISHAAKGVIGGDSQLVYLARVVFKASGFYARKLFYPFPLNFGIVNIANYYILVGIVVIAFLCYLLWKWNLISALFISAYLLGSSSFLVAISKMAWTPIAERYMYIPCGFFSIAVVFAFAAGLNKPVQKTVVCIFTLLYAAAAYATVARNIIWQDNLTLFADTVRKSPEFQTAKNDLAAALIEKGRKVEAFSVISSIKLSNANGSYNELGVLDKVVYMQNRGRLLEARKFLIENHNENSKLYEEFIKKLIGIDEAIINDGVSPDFQQELRQEIVELMKKLQIRTQNPFYLYRIGQLYLKTGDLDAARSYFLRASIESPDNAYYKTAAAKLAENLRKK